MSSRECLLEGTALGGVKASHRFSALNPGRTVISIRDIIRRGIAWNDCTLHEHRHRYRALFACSWSLAQKVVQRWNKIRESNRYDFMASQEKFGSEEVRLAPITPLPTILSKSFSVLFCPPGFFFRVTPDTFVMVLGTSTRCSVSYRFRGSHSLITPHLFPISYYARDRSRKVLEVIASRTPPPA